MKKNGMYTIMSNKKINYNDTYEMILKGDTSEIVPGGFVEVKIPGVFLPRPFSIASYSHYYLNIVYKVVGEGTEIMSRLPEGSELEVLTGLGNGFDLTVNTKRPLLVGGGTGVAPIYNLAVYFHNKGIKPLVVIGFKAPEDIFYIKEFYDFGISPFTVIESQPNHMGSLVTDVIPLLEDVYDYFYACGPKGMLKAVCDIAQTDGEVSLESRMACGIGQCKCCSIETNDGMKTLCKDGPVLKKGLVRW